MINAFYKKYREKIKKLSKNRMSENWAQKC